MKEGAKLNPHHAHGGALGRHGRYGHVNNTVYFRYFEQARCEWLEQMGFRVSPRADGP